MPSYQAMEVGRHRIKRMRRWQIRKAVFECLDCGGNETILLEGKMSHVSGFCDGACRVRFV